jgi:hypothetical protein
MAKQSRPLSATFVAGGIGVIGSSIAYLQAPVLYLGWAVGLFLSVGCPLSMFVWNQRQQAQDEDDIGDLSRREIGEILDNPPTLKDERLTIVGNWMTGHRFVMSLKIKNNRDILLDGLEASIEITDMERNKEKAETFIVPDLGSKESQEQTFKVGLGRGPTKKYKVVFLVYRMGFEVARKHFSLEKPLFGFVPFQATKEINPKF